MAKLKRVIIEEVDLRKLREKAGLSLRRLEQASKVSFAHINKIENDKLVMSETTWKRLSKVLDKYNKYN